MTAEHIDGAPIGAGTVDMDAEQVQVTVHGAPDDSADGAARVSGRAAVMRVLEAFSNRPFVGSARIMMDRGADRPAQHATLYRPAHGNAVVVVGGGTLAAAVRGLFPHQGWHVRAEPSPGTDLATIRGALGPRVYNTLVRDGITTVEDLAAIPDMGLLDLRLMGPGSIERIRTAVVLHTSTPANSSAGSAGPVTLTPGQAREARTLLGVLAVMSQARGDDATAVRADAVCAALDTSGADAATGH
ncbi:hypothetical protein [Dactylosporangium sp. NPDC000521]|uniref:hypothetical protein n=1 Tax=Dactylosporangium sp. NPDC000521 TaxID=3363975 RepID=UPI00368B3EB1